MKNTMLHPTKTKMIFASLFFLMGWTGLASAKYTTYENVETLLDDVEKKVGQEVLVSGDVDGIKDLRTFVLEGGGIINDKVTVIAPKSLESQTRDMVKKGARLQVTGKLVKLNRVEIEKEYGWDFDPQIEIELDEVDHFLVADKIEVLKTR